MSAAKKPARKPVAVKKATLPKRDIPFSNRLVAALDSNPHIPEMNQGRLTWVRDEFLKRYKIKVSTETVRKWVSGEARPRPNKMNLLARLIEADEAWLALGVAPELDLRARDQRSLALSGAANFVLGLVQMDGGAVAYPNDNDLRADRVHFYAIIKGAQYAIHAALAQKTDEGLRFTLPMKGEDCMQLGVVRRQGTCCDILEIPSDVIAAHSTSKGGFRTLDIVRKGDGYFAGGTKIPQIKGFAERL